MASIVIGIIVIFVFVSAVLRIDRKMAIVVGIGLLIGTAFTLARGNDNLANRFALSSYYAIATGILIMLIDQLKLVPESWSNRCLNFVASNLIALLSWISDYLKRFRSRG